MRTLRIVSIFALVAMVFGCTPESLEGFEDGNNGGNNANNANNANNTSNNATNNVGGAFTTEFIEVAGIMTSNCTQAACHGSFSTNAFTVVSDQLADEAEIQGALEGVTAMTSGMPLVDPSNSAGSDIFDRMNRESGDPLVMPQTGKLDQATIDVVQAWIDNGAQYRM